MRFCKKKGEKKDGCLFYINELSKKLIGCGGTMIITLVFHYKGPKFDTWSLRFAKLKKY